MAAAGFAGHGHRRGRRGVVAAAHLARVARARGRPRRLGAVQNPMLPIYRAAGGRLRHPAGRHQAADRPGHLAGLRLRAPWRTRIAAEQPGLPVLTPPTASCPTATRRRCRPRRWPPASAADLPIRWYYYTSGTTADPRAPSTPTPPSRRRPRACARPSRCSPSDRIGCVFPFTHIGRRRLRVQRPGLRVPHARRRGLRRRGHPADPARRRRHPRRRRHAVPQAYLAYQRAHPDEAPDLPGAPGAHRRRRPQAARSCTTTSSDELGGVGICSGYGMTEAPDRHHGRRPRHRRAARRHRGPRPSRAST